MRVGEERESGYAKDEICSLEILFSTLNKLFFVKNDCNFFNALLIQFLSIPLVTGSCERTHD